MDEQPVQVVKETRQPLETAPGRPRLYDHEYERAGTACIFLFTEAVAGWREVSVRPQRTALDWAQERHACQRGVDWHFTTKDARIKLKRLYPEVQLSWTTSMNANTRI